MKAKLAVLLLFVPSMCVNAQSTQPQSNNPDEATARAAESLRLANEAVKRFGYFFANDPDKKLKFQPTPVHRHSHTYTGEVYTNLFVWTYQGRAEAIASISNWYSPRRYHGLAVTSLATEKLIGTRDGKEIWHPKSAGVSFTPIADVGKPNESAAQRLRQMRVLARDFTAEFKRVARYLEGGKLRLLSTPLFRYQNQDAKLIDGAIFALANGTVPMVLLIIEARPSPTGGRWEYALAPRDSSEFHVWHKGREVWNLPQLAPPWPNSKIPTNTFTVFPDLQREGRTEEFVDQLLEFQRSSQRMKTNGS